MHQMGYQCTLAEEATVCGVGFLWGHDVSLRFLPAEPNSGVRFVRVDLPGRPQIPAHIQYVKPRARRTVLQTPRASVDMVEHVLAALAGLGVDNCTIEINAPETPGCDGSCEPFLRALAGAGLVRQPAPRRIFTVDRPYWVQSEKALLAILPWPQPGLFVSYHLDYGQDSPIGRQSFGLEVTAESFRRLLAPARTFLLESEAQALRAEGLGARTRPCDLLIFGPDGPVDNALRFPDEPVRHKVMDIIGDLSLLGHRISGYVVAHRSGHRLNAELTARLAAAAEVATTTRGPAEAEERSEPAVILNLLAHRYPALLVDRVLKLEPGRRAVAVKQVQPDEPYFRRQARPAVPGAVLVEAMAQLAGLLFSQGHWARTVSSMRPAVENVKLLRQVGPGQQLRIEATTVGMGPSGFLVRAQTTAEGQEVAAAEFRFSRPQAQAA